MCEGIILQTVRRNDLFQLKIPQIYEVLQNQNQRYSDEHGN